MNDKKKLLLSAGILVILLVVFFAAYRAFSPRGNAFEKTIEVEIISAQGHSKTYEIMTNEEYLRGALEQLDLVKGTESDYGLYVLTVDGTTADESQNEWWCFTRNGEELFTGVDATPILDGEHYEITLKTWTD